MIKSILWDADGVTIKKHEYFSGRLSRQYGIPVEKIMRFFKNEFQLCAVGKGDLKEELGKYLSQWGISTPTNELLEWWFSGESQADEEVLGAIKNLRAKGTKVYLVTDQEKYRAAYILDHMGFKHHFDQTFFSCFMGYRKSDKEFFEHILSEIKEQPRDVLYWDDDEKNIEVARSTGISAEVYTSFEDFNSKMRHHYQLLTGKVTD